ncbi:VapE domain-containing protein [Hymenobacter sp. HD11105]
MALPSATGPPGPIKNNPLQRQEDYLNKHCDFRFNQVKGRIEFRNKGEPEFRPLLDYDTNSLWRALSKAKIRSPISTLINVLHSSFTPKYDPFLEYLDSLPPWDQTTDYLQLLADTVNTTNNELWSRWLRKWVVAMVGSLKQTEVVNHSVLVLAGGQGVGKTTWIENLAPRSLKEYTFSGVVDPGNKDTLVHLAECMLINLDELENLSKSEIGALKSLITQSTINLRRPYARSSEKLPRRASFAGSINSRQFLNDTTGSRRFLCTDVVGIDNAHNLDMDLVLSQALWLFENGFQFWFDQNEIAEVHENNHQYQHSTYEEEMLLKAFSPAKKDEAGSLFWTTSEIAAELRSCYNVGNDPGSLLRLGKALAKNAFVRSKKSDQRYKYWLKRVDGGTIDPLLIPGFNPGKLR